MDLCAAAWKLGYGEWGNSAFPKQISIFLESYVVSCISENYICLLISTGHGLSLCQWNLVLWELMDRWMWKLIACLGLSHVSCQWVFSRAQLQYQEAGFHICWHAPCPFVSRNFAALEIRHISRRKMVCNNNIYGEEVESQKIYTPWSVEKNAWNFSNWP